SVEATAAFEQPKPRRSRRRKSAVPSPEQPGAPSPELPGEAGPQEQPPAPPSSSRRGTRRRRPQPSAVPEGDAAPPAPTVQLGDSGMTEGAGGRGGGGRPPPAGPDRSARRLGDDRRRRGSGRAGISHLVAGMAADYYIC